MYKTVANCCGTTAAAVARAALTLSADVKFVAFLRRPFRRTLDRAALARPRFLAIYPARYPSPRLIDR